MQIAVIGLDLAKNVFQVHGIDDLGQAVLKRKLRRSEVLPFFAGLDAALVGIEACHTAHYWGREIAALGHDVRLRCRRCRGDRRSRAKTHDAICANQICGSAGCSNAAPDARLTDLLSGAALSAPFVRILPNLASWLDKASAMLNGCLLFLKRQEISAYRRLRQKCSAFWPCSCARHRLHGRNIAPSCLSAHGSWALVLVGAHGLGQHSEHAKGRGVLLGYHHPLSDARHCAWRLDGGRHGPRLCRRRRRFLCGLGTFGCGLLLDEDFQGGPILGGIYPHQAAGRDRWRLPRQAS